MRPRASPHVTAGSVVHVSDIRAPPLTVCQSIEKASSAIRSIFRPLSFHLPNRTATINPLHSYIYPLLPSPFPSPSLLFFFFFFLFLPMDLLEIPLDARAFRLYALPADAAVAYLALLAAAAFALGLWSIRGAAVSYKPASTVASISCSPPQDASLSEPKLDLASLPAAFHLSDPSPSSRTPKARFTAYYSAEAESLDDNREDPIDRDFDETDRRSRGAPRSGDWSLEWTAVKRAGHLGWYSYQDLMELNGNVVKLWDARPTPAAMLLRRRL